jgi:hypothetical protein
MPIIRNKLDQRLIVNLKSGKNIDLFAKSTADVSEEDLSSLHLQNLVAKGDIIVSSEKIEEKKGKDIKTSPSYVKGNK